MVTPIQHLDVRAFISKEPVTSTQDANTGNSYLEGGPFFYALHGEISSATVDVNATPAERAEALKDLPVILTKGHIEGSRYSKPSDTSQTILIKVPKAAEKPLKELEEWACNEVLVNQAAWKLKPESESVVRSRFEPLLKQKEGTEGYAMTCKFFTPKIKIFLQNAENPDVFDPNGTQYDLKQGCRCAIVLEIRGIRIKPKEFAVQTPIIAKIYVFSGSGSVAPDVDFGLPVTFSTPISAKRAADDSADAAPRPPPANRYEDAVSAAAAGVLHGAHGEDMDMDDDGMGTTVVT